MIMKKIISFLIAVTWLLTASAQTPQAVCYQGVATDQQGRELVSQNIRVRLSILKTSAAGVEEWVETHSVTTDGFGLFDLPIGIGTRTGGAQTAFSNIKWGADKYYLKVEMDIAGGSSYVLMGVNQLISVPYALYSDKTGVADSAVAASRSVTSITAITANTAIYSTTSGRSNTSGRADTASFAFLSDSARRAGTAQYAFNAGNAQYAINAGRALTAGRSDTAQFAWLADSARRAATAQYAVNAGNAQNAIYANNAGRALTAGRSDTAQYAWIADSARRAGTAQYAGNAGNALTAGHALTANRSDTAKFAWLADSARRAAYANNAGRSLTAGRSDTAQFAWLADSARRAAYANNAGRSLTAGRSDTAQFAWVADSARRSATAVLAKRATVADSAILADHSIMSERSTFASQASYAYIADSSRRADLAHRAYTALDDNDRSPTNEIQTMSYDTLARTLKLTKLNGQFDQVNFSGTPLGAAGASIDYPYGILGEAVLITSNYVVPNGKTLFISAANNPIILMDGRRLNIEPGMPILPTGTSISTCFCSGILVKTETYAEPIILDFATANFEYLVPIGKSFVIKSGTNDSRDMSFVIDGTNYSFYTGSSASPRLIVIPEGKRMRRGLTNVGTNFMVTGYLLTKTP
jgi:protein involved in temperature-dependent protein secretion